jgi:hypothetical protein
MTAERTGDRAMLLEARRATAAAFDARLAATAPG